MKKKRKLWVGDFDRLEDAVQAYKVAAIKYGKTPPLPKIEEEEASPFFLRQARLSYAAAYNDCHNWEGRVVQTQAPKSLVQQGVEVTGGVDMSTPVPVFEDPEKIGSTISIKNFELENARVSSYHMFARDLPGMPFFSYTIHGMGRTSKSM